MEKKRPKRLNFVDLRLQQDWNNLHTEKYALESFAVTLEPPLRNSYAYSIRTAISAPTTLYNDKPYRV